MDNAYPKLNVTDDPAGVLSLSGAWDVRFNRFDGKDYNQVQTYEEATMVSVYKRDAEGLAVWFADIDLKEPDK